MKEKHHLRNVSEDPDELRVMIANYERTRRQAAPSMHRWLDALIEDAGQRLAKLTHGAGVTAAADGLDGDVDDTRRAVADSGGSDALPTEARERARRTYPFDERAPRQRPDLLSA